MAMQLIELARPSGRQKVLSSREHLPKFYEGRPELLEGELCAFGQLEMRDLARFSPLQNLAGALEQGSDPGATYEISEPMPHEDRADLAQAWQLAGGAEQPEDHAS